jgi:hypothetical protein
MVVPSSVAKNWASTEMSLKLIRSDGHISELAVEPVLLSRFGLDLDFQSSRGLVDDCDSVVSALVLPKVVARFIHRNLVR